MPQYSQESANKLAGCHDDLVMLFSQVIKYYDVTILYGHRTPQEQYELYKKGRETEGDIVTYKDGYNNKSKHNFVPSLAVDAVTYPINWGDYKSHYYLGGLVMGIYHRLKREGLIKNEIRWGGNWDRDDDLHDQNFNDLFHFEIIKIK